MRASLSPSISASASSDTRCARRRAAVGQADFDQKRIAAIDGRRPRGGDVELAGHDLVQALEHQLLADRRDAIGRRGGDLRLLNRLIERVGLVPADLASTLARVLSLAVSQIFRATLELTRENDSREKLRDRRALRVFEHRHQPAQLDAVGMRLDLLRLGRQADRSSVDSRVSLLVGIVVVES